MRRALILAALVACKSSSPTASATITTASATSVTTGVAVASASSLPSDFPAAGAPKVTGTLVSKAFTVAKAIARRSPDGSSIDLYSWSAGDACEPQFAPNPDQLYVSVNLPDAKMKSGTVLRAHEDGVIVVYKTPSIGGPPSEATVVIDDANATHTTGRILLTGAEGTRVAGSFDATTCASPQQGASASAPLLGVAWGTEVDPAALPRGQVTMTLLGKNAAPAAVEAIDWDDGQYAQHEIHFFSARPAKPCNTDQMSGGFKIGFPSKLSKGLSMRSSVMLVTAKGSPFSVAMWQEPGGVLGMEGRGFVSAVLDDVTSATIRGRVVAWSNDASKSLIVGAFEATNCHVKL